MTTSPPAGQTRGPTFLCVGMPKAGTTWLFHQLAALPGYAMPPLKELHFFDVPAKHRMGNYARQFDAAEVGPDRNALSFRDAANAASSLDEYRALFAFAEDRITGDVTPAYCALPYAKIASIRLAMPDVKVTMLVRDPVERAWATIRSLATAGKLTLHDSLHWLPIRGLLEAGHVASFAATSECLRRWTGQFEVRAFFFDHISRTPAQALSEVDTFLVGRDAAQQDIKPLRVPKNTGIRLPMPKTLRAKIVEYYEADLRECAAMLGEPARRWRDRHLRAATPRSRSTARPGTLARSPANLRPKSSKIIG